MRKKNDFFVYTCMWIAAVAVLMALLMQNMGDARIVNYSGIVRGATQKLVKEELNGQQNDALIGQLDGIIENLRTGKGEFDLRMNSDWEYQQRLANLKHIWERIKKEIYEVREGKDSSALLYELSEEHFNEADKMVLRAEQSSENKLIRFIVIYGAVLVLSVCIFNVFNDRSRKALEASIFTDNLTGMLNKAGFEARAAGLLRQHTENRYALIELDIDDFKFLNNSYGYEMGDKMLRALADGLMKKYHTDQLCARISADDFVVLAKQEQGIIDELHAVLSEIIHQELLPIFLKLLPLQWAGMRFRKMER
ncbi:diguanylate cyclase [Clostridium sp. AM58-1XD]|uniref:diguanylate cyclase domain-containing protein n=1 Tax=Clostridium sp. AM58-1XD TaxID=2292307 RepID=UPI000E52D136|nr:diguanylate cyclase [Clostridium sp. AM58-1XD]RGZ00425.1 diguanylate cyclase [Clostridium sp. AM58-1XD]